MLQLRARIRTKFHTGYSKFFRRRLLTASADEINGMIDSMEKEANSIREEGFKLAWHMRGGITYEQVLQLSNNERRMIAELAKDNIETTKKTNLPFF